MCIRDSVGIVLTNINFLLGRYQKKYNGKFIEHIRFIGKTILGKFLLKGVFLENIWEENPSNIDKKISESKVKAAVYFVADTRAMRNVYLPLYAGKLIFMFAFNLLNRYAFYSSLCIGSIFMLVFARIDSMVIDFVEENKK